MPMPQTETKSRPLKKLHIKTYGCQMNVYDSERIGDVLLPLGYAEAPEYQNADMVVLNTCHIREKAAEKVYSELGRINEEKLRLKEEGKRMIIAVAGCVAQAEGDEIKRRAPYVDLVVGPQSYQRLPKLMENLDAAKPANNGVMLDFAAEDKFDNLPTSTQSKGATAFLTIQEGCDKFCHFCVVPYTRGAEFSRPAQAIIDEAKQLVDQGVLDITLLGQNVNAYHGTGPYGDTWNLASLMRALSEIEGLVRIRYTTSHPQDVDAEQIAMHRDLPKVMPYLHLPVQSGSDSILKAMNRKHTADSYRRTMEQFRKARPDIAFSSDFIVGYPGETDKDFQETLKLVGEIGYGSAYSFIYSPRPGTPAAMKDDTIPMAEKKARLQELQSLLQQQQTDLHRAMIGQTIPVLFVREGKYEGHITGYSPYQQPVFMNAGAQAASYMNRIVEVQITDANMRYLEGILPGAAETA